MKFSLSIFALLAAPVFAQDQCSTTWKCHSTSTPPVLDADHSDWESVEAFTTSLVSTLGVEYDAGQATYKCLYDSENIYFAMEIPGEYGFNTTDNHHCAAIGTMFKVGAKAEYVNMGNCPDAMGGCADGVPDTCTDYLVDIGAHWELKDTEQNTLYGLASSSSSRQGGTGNDPIANNDDEYAVSPYCRFDDDDANADNEWSGAWAHTNPVQGEFGTYHFEVSRTLKTASTVSDAQLTPGETVQFGLAFWDPFEVEGSGWTDIGHFVTGCGRNWIDLELVVEGAESNEVEDEEVEADDESATSSAAFIGASLPVLLWSLYATAY